MANRTVKDAQSIKGTNPQYLIEKITRTRIYESKYWKEQCFALTAELVVDRAMELRYVGGVYGGNVKPTPFLCLLLKMLQIQPEKDIVIYFITQQDYKYTRALGAIYLRLTGSSMDCYKYLEPLLLDYRKIRVMDKDGAFQLSHMDEFIDGLLHEERMCDIILPRIQKRQVLEETNQLEPRVSALDDDLEEMETSDEDEDFDKKVIEDVKPPSPDRRTSHRDWDKPKRSPSPRYRRPSPHRSRDIRDHHREVPSHDHHRDRRRSRSRERHRHRESQREREREKRRSHKYDENDDRHHHHHHHKSKKAKREKDSSREDPEIRLANEQRARLGLAPLRP
ncbi:hypothetical protein LSH36_647g01007 [Paralvinella palmiformis]|uniref:Pre-mRNA-splicing factor 38 n=1 Tax=Paralvinella palmiformis TaxID=53620 RepID=A0AAD9J4D4_9ANNE|nr:hypothetical protein LSH36_647g01007 [Paralvinella palmiformis]